MPTMQGNPRRNDADFERAPDPFLSLSLSLSLSVPRNHCEKKLDRKNPAWPTSDGAQSLRAPAAAARPSGIQIFRQSFLRRFPRRPNFLIFALRSQPLWRGTRFLWISARVRGSFFSSGAVLSRGPSDRPSDCLRVTRELFVVLIVLFWNATTLFSYVTHALTATMYARDRNLAQWKRERRTGSPWDACWGPQGKIDSSKFLWSHPKSKVFFKTSPRCFSIIRNLKFKEVAELNILSVRTNSSFFANCLYSEMPFSSQNEHRTKSVDLLSSRETLTQ